MIMTEIIVNIPWATLFIQMLLWYHLESVYMNSSTLHCDDGAIIKTSDYCDNVRDCADGTDEYNCENDIIVFYNALSSKQTPEHSTFKMIHIGTPWYFEKKVGKPLNDEDRIISVAINDNRIYYVLNSTFHNGTRSTTLWRVRRSGHIYSSKYSAFIEIGKDPDNSEEILVSNGGDYESFDLDDIVTHLSNAVNLTRITSDRITGNMYLLFVNESTGSSWIKVCQIYTEKFEMCSFLNKNILMTRPVDIAFSSEDLALFWIEKKNNSTFSVVKARPDGSLAFEIVSNLFSPRSLFPDDIEKHLYWLEGNHIYAVKFDGTKKKLITELTEYVPLIAAFRDTLYWIYSKQKAIFTCNRTNCLQTARANLSDSYPVSVLYVTSALRATQNNEKNPCDESRCSDLCLPISTTDYTCTCNVTAESQMNKASVNEYLCEDTTILIATGKERSSLNVLFKGFSSGILVKSLNYTTKKAISAWSYDSINDVFGKMGNLVLAYVGEQNIYSISLKNMTTTLILSDSTYGTIKSLQFDDFGNNVYWINPTNYCIKVINLNTLRTKTVYQGTPTNIPSSMTLAPNKGFMFLAFIENNRFIKIERHRMDGKGSNITIIHKEDLKNVNMKSTTIHYQRHMDILFFTLEGFDKMAYFTDPTNSENFNYEIKYKAIGKKLFASSLTSIERKLLWIPTTGKLRVEICEYELKRFSNSDCEEFGCNADLLGDLKIIGISQATEKQSPCHKNNGECDHLCLASLNKNFTCACADNMQLTHSSKCIDLSVLGNSFTTMIHWLIFALIFGLICGCIAYFYRIRMCGQQLLSQRFSLRESMNHFSLVNNEVG